MAKRRAAVAALVLLGCLGAMLPSGIVAASPVDVLPVHGLPPGVPPAARQPEPTLPAPETWQFSEDFPRTMGTGAMREGALLWTDFIYDDNGAISGPGLGESPGAWPFGTYRYPEDNQAGNGADIFRAGIAVNFKRPNYTWWRVDWNTLIDPSVPAAAFAIDEDRSGGAASTWGGNVGVSSSGVDSTLIVTAAGAFLDGTRVGPTFVDMEAKSFVARVPASKIAPEGRDRVWLAAGLANDAGDAFRSLGPQHQHLPGQPNVFNMGFRTYRDEPADKNFWFERTQATTLTPPNANVDKFAHTLDWDFLRAGRSQLEGLVRGWSNRWYVSSIELGQGRVKEFEGIVDREPNYLGRVQPYGVYIPKNYNPKERAAPLTWLLHSLTINHNQYSATMPDLIRLACEQRDSICATTLGRGPDGFYRQEAELDFWEVWRTLNRSYLLDPDRTIIGGFSMGGFGTFNMALDHPDVFAGMVILAAAANEDEPRLENARWVPYYHAHGMLDELVPYYDEALPTIERLDDLGYRYVFDTYPTKDHIVWSLEDGNDLAGQWIAERNRERRRNTGYIVYRWFPREVNRKWGIGPTGAWWVRGLAARDRNADSARVRAVSLALPERPVTVRRSEKPLIDPNGSPVVRRELRWVRGERPAAKPCMNLGLTNVARVRLDMPDTRLLRYSRSTIRVTSDGPATITLANLPAGAEVRLNGKPSDRTPSVGKGKATITIVR